LSKHQHSFQILKKEYAARRYQSTTMGLISTSPISATFLVPVDIYFAHLVIAGTGQFSNGLVTPIMLELVVP